MDLSVIVAITLNYRECSSKLSPAYRTGINGGLEIGAEPCQCRAEEKRWRRLENNVKRKVSSACGIVYVFAKQ